MKMTSILIVDDSQIHLEGLKLVLGRRPDIRVTGQASSSGEALACLKAASPDVALLDISLETQDDGLELARNIRRLYPQVRVVMLTHYKNARYLVGALQAGACAYLPKDTNPDELLHAIDAVGQGKGVYLGDTIPMANLLEAFGSERNIAKGKPCDLSEREVAVVRLMAQGLTAKEIASVMEIEVNTIESHKERIKEKLGVNTALQIVVAALKRGIISLED